MLINIKLQQGTSKAGNPYYMLTTIAGDFKSQPVFISKLEYDYLEELQSVPDFNQE